jgi:alkylation response protein AidB-like acyl-CoA dehydrogenase
MELARALGKTPVEVNDYPGFVANRILMPMINEAVYCVMEGVGTPEAIDTVMKLGMNHPMGPLTLADFIGLDTCLAILEVMHRGLGDPKYRPCPLLRKYVAAGWLGPEGGARLLHLRVRADAPSAWRARAPRAPATHASMLFEEILPLTDTQREIRDLARAFARDQIAPHAAAWDRDSYFEPALVRAMGELGFLGMLIPEEYDGLGLDTTSYLLALEEIAAADASAAVTMSVHNSLPTQMLLRWGTEAQKDRFLRPMARGELLGAFALSEPDSGSDAAALRCQAVRDGDDWVLTGTKAWVTSGTHAGVIVAMARTDSDEMRRGGRGISAFVVTPDLPGFSVGKKENKLGLRASPTVQLVFDEMRVPGDRLLGEAGHGFVYALQSLDHGRLGIAAQSVGIARAALEQSRAYADQRHQFRRPIRDFQAIQFKLADMAMRLTAARALLYQAAAAKDAGTASPRTAPWPSSSPARPRCSWPTRRCRSSGGTATSRSTPSSATSATPRSPRSTRAPPKSSAW